MGGLTDYDYDAAGNLSRTSFANGVVETREYDPLNRLTFLENRGVAGVLSSYRYTLDAVGNRKEVLEADGRKVIYSYDDLYRLTQEQILEPGKAGRTITFEYDKVGNRLKRIDSLEGTTTYSYDVNDRLLAEVLNGQTISYSYDNNGSLTAKAINGQTEAEYRWNAKGELAGATISSGGSTATLSYEYDQDGIRVAATLNGQETRFLIDKTQQRYAQVIEEYLANGSLLKSYSHGWDLLSQDDGTNRTYYQVDGLGSTRLITDSSGNVQLAYDYQAFGELLNQSGSGSNSYLFAGEQFDQSLDLTYLRARYYDMGTGRLISVDPFEGTPTSPITLHDYAYSYVSPCAFADPSGKTAASVDYTLDLSLRLSLLSVRTVTLSSNVGKVSFTSTLIGIATVCLLLRTASAIKLIPEAGDLILISSPDFCGYKQTCRPYEKQILDNEVDLRCKNFQQGNTAPKKCGPPMTREQARENAIRFEKCAEARDNVIKKCYYPNGDTGHYQGWLQAMNGATSCWKYWRNPWK